MIKSHGHVIHRTERLMYCMISKMLRCIFKVHYVYLFFIVKSGLTSCKGFLNSFVSRHFKKGGQTKIFIYNWKVFSWKHCIVYCCWTVNSSSWHYQLFICYVIKNKNHHRLTIEKVFCNWKRSYDNKLGESIYALLIFT